MNRFVDHERSAERSNVAADSGTRIEPQTLMKSLRLLLVVPRFWPHVGETEIIAGHLADELVTLGAQPTVLSSQWAPGWPASMVVREVSVVRLHHAPRGGWNTLRYMIDLTRWLRRRRNEFNAVYVLSLRHEAYATLLALSQVPIPIVLRCQESGFQGDCAWQTVSRFGDRLRARCRSADAIVTPTATVAAELEQSGYDRRKIQIISGGAKVGVGRTSDHRFRARNYLAEANQDLATAEYSPVVVWVGKLNEMAVFLPLLKAWRDVAARWPTARLWLIGEGPARSALYTQIIDWELQYQVLMPGTFEDLNDVLLAADAYVAFDPSAGNQFVIEAMSAGLPVIGAECPDIQSMIEHGHSGFIVPSHDQAAWVAALSLLCDNPSTANKMGHAAQDTVRRKFSSTQMAQRHLELFHALIGEKK